MYKFLTSHSFKCCKIELQNKYSFRYPYELEKDLYLIHLMVTINPCVYSWFMLTVRYFLIMMMSPNGNIFRVTGSKCGEFTGDQWIPLT